MWLSIVPGHCHEYLTFPSKIYVYMSVGETANGYYEGMKRLYKETLLEGSVLVDINIFPRFFSICIFPMTRTFLRHKQFYSYQGVKAEKR